MIRQLCIWLICFSCNLTYSQAPYIIRYIPGSFNAEKNRHRVEIYNSSSKFLKIGGWLLITRDYVVRLPDKTFIQPGKTLKLGLLQSNEQWVDMELMRTGDFWKRSPDKTISGNYVVLMNEKQKIIDAFYFAPNPTSVSFLPEVDSCVTRRNGVIRFEIPDEKNEAWKYLVSIDDPAIGFVRKNNEWTYTSSNVRKNILPSVAFQNFTIRYRQKRVTLKWNTIFEDNCKQVEIERSEDNEFFQVIGTLETKGYSKTPQSYTYFDYSVKPEKTYYYRIKNVDDLGYVVATPTQEITTHEVPVEFWWDVYPTVIQKSEAIRIRFYSYYPQKLKIKILDEAMREIAILYNSQIQADNQNLIWFQKTLQPGIYTIIAATEHENHRYFQKVRVLP
ncbi:MAG: lamin tail domain-containing protein [Bacteroidia bacterium]|nr:lamin tail domain-containing protein [Bacteroidia bacterium]